MQASSAQQGVQSCSLSHKQSSKSYITLKREQNEEKATPGPQRYYHTELNQAYPPINADLDYETVKKQRMVASLLP